MAGRPDVLGLLERMLDEGRTPEEVCRDCPELLTEVQQRWLAFRLIDAEVDAFLPEPETRLESGSNSPDRPIGSLPRIPGYEIQSVLGHGGIGVVYKALHVRSNRIVALKMLLAGAHASTVELARFQREAEAVASLRHPNIVQIFDVADHEGRPFYTMEFVEGGNLAGRLAGVGQPARDAARLVGTLAQAIDAAHRAGIIHRDLKPGNILLTANDQPKISDFGLARRLEFDPQFTQTGVPIGTPSYMAPEQAEGRAGQIGPAADTYALGAILYEMLTGRPPFGGETSAETVLQVIGQEPAPPSKLNVRVPRDLEIICLKCLRKEPQSRYESAGALADDLDRFVQGEAIVARPESRVERMARTVRRRPGLAIGLAIGGLLTIALIVASLWLSRERAANERATSELNLLAQDRRDRDFVARLDAIRLNRTAIFDGTSDTTLNTQLNKSRADAEYEAAFRDSGIAVFEGDADQVAEQLRASSIYGPLSAAFDDWAGCAPDPARRERLFDIAARGGLDRTGLRRKLRDPAVWSDRTALNELAWKALDDQRSTRLLVLLGERLRESGGDAVAFQKVVQQRHPGDFWANFMLGDALWRDNAGEAVRFYQAALALKPDAAVVHNNLARALAYAGRMDDSIDQLHLAIEKEPGFAHAHSNLGLALRAKKLHEEALKQFTLAVQYGPQHAETHLNLGIGLVDLGRIDQAVEKFRQALAINPNLAAAHAGLGRCAKVVGQPDRAIDHFGTALRLDPRQAANHVNMGFSLMERGQVEDGIKLFQSALGIDSKCVGAHSGLSAAFKKTGRLEEAIDHARKAADLASDDARLQFDFGLALADARKFDDAVGPLEHALRLDPGLAEAYGRLGGVYSATGRFQDARDALARCLELLPPMDSRRTAISDALNRSERLLALERRLPAVLSGSDRPRSTRETLEFLQICQAKKQYREAVSLFELIVATEPDDLDSTFPSVRYVAACCAAAAGCGRGDDSAAVDESDRSRWRGEAREWLGADLTLWTNLANDGDRKIRSRIKTWMTHWRKDANLACVRDPKALALLPFDEREHWEQLWSDVDALLRRVSESK